MSNTTNNNTPVKSGMATASLVLGIIATVTVLGGFFPCLGVVALWLSVPCALIGLALALFAPKGSSKMPGLILSAIALLLAVGACSYQAEVVNEMDKGFQELDKEFQKLDTNW